MPKYTPFLTKLKREERPFLEGESVDLYGGNVIHYKNVHHSISTLPMGIGNTLAVFKTNQQSPLLNEWPGLLPSWQNRRGEECSFWTVQKGGSIVRLPPRAIGCYKR